MSAVRLWRKRPVVVEAVLWDGTDGAVAALGTWSGREAVVRHFLAPGEVVRGSATPAVCNTVSSGPSMGDWYWNERLGVVCLGSADAPACRRCVRALRNRLQRLERLLAIVDNGRRSA